MRRLVGSFSPKYRMISLYGSIAMRSATKIGYRALFHVFPRPLANLLYVGQKGCLPRANGAYFTVIVTCDPPSVNVVG